MTRLIAWFRWLLAGPSADAVRDKRIADLLQWARDYERGIEKHFELARVQRDEDRRESAVFWKAQSQMDGHKDNRLLNLETASKLNSELREAVVKHSDRLLALEMAPKPEPVKDDPDPPAGWAATRARAEAGARMS